MTRQEQRRNAEAWARQGLDRHEWRSAREVAAQLGMPWRMAARALLRLVEKGVAQDQVVAWKDGQHRPRESRRYRATTVFDPAALPGWLALPPRE